MERVQRVNQLIKRELSQLLLRETNFPKNILVTITRVVTLPNLIESRVFISTMPEREMRKVLTILNRQVYGFQQKINRKLKMRPVPRIKFLEEKETASASRIEEILEELKKEEKQGKIKRILRGLGHELDADMAGQPSSQGIGLQNQYTWVQFPSRP